MIDTQIDHSLKLDNQFFTTVSQVTNTLFITGTSDDLTLHFEPGDFGLVVTLYGRAPRIQMTPDFRLEIPDGPLRFDTKVHLGNIARLASNYTRLGQRVLFRCQAGLNRSSLAAALTLMENGYSAASAIDTIRDHRHGQALFNPFFEAFIYDYEDTRIPDFIEVPG